MLLFEFGGDWIALVSWSAMPAGRELLTASSILDMYKDGARQAISPGFPCLGVGREANIALKEIRVQKDTVYGWITWE